MGTGSAIYRIVLLLHVAAAVVGFGGLIAAGILNKRAFDAPGPAAATLLRGSQAVSQVAHLALYALLVLGIVLPTVSDGAIDFAAPWISASFVVWFLIVGVAHGLVRPALAGLLATATGTDRAGGGGGATPETAGGAEPLRADEGAQALAKRLALGEALVQVGLVVALVLMIWQPGA